MMGVFTPSLAWKGLMRLTGPSNLTDSTEGGLGLISNPCLRMEPGRAGTGGADIRSSIEGRRRL